MDTELPIGLLRTFATVSEANSFTRAGEIIHITQSAVSMQMKRLEELVGRPLFRKNGRRFHLTADGEMLREHAQRILAAHNAAVAAFSHPDLVGSVRFGCAEDYASRFLPTVLSEFRSAYPRIRVDIRSGPSTDLHQSLLNRSLDLCLLEGVAQGGHVVHREPVVWATARNGTAHELDPLPLAVYDEGCRYRQWALEALHKIKRDYWIAFVSPSMASILAAVKAGLAVAPVGRNALNNALRLLGPEEGYPLLPVSEVRLHQGENVENEVVACFASHVTASFQKLVL